MRFEEAYTRYLENRTVANYQAIQQIASRIVNKRPELRGWLAGLAQDTYEEWQGERKVSTG